MKALGKKWSVVLLALGIFLSAGKGNLYAQEVLLSDTLFKNFSVEDLVELRRLLARGQQLLIRKQEETREEGLEISQEFIGKSKEESANQDKILIRIAEYYIEEAQNEYLRAMEDYNKALEEYDRQMQAYEEGRLQVQPQEPIEPRPNYEKAIAIYDILINNFPESDLVDDAFYNKAFLLQEMREERAAQETWQALIDKFPESPYVAEAYMSLAEFYFNTKQSDSKETIKLKLNKAIQLYKNVLRYKNTSRYNEALYKLGWSYYRLAGDDPQYYTDAILYFTTLVQDLEMVKKMGLDKNKKVSRVELEPEALEYIAASFVDPNYEKHGVHNAREFVLRLGKPTYGIDILEQMGNRYAKITYWNDAVAAYQTLLELYPDYAFAPRIQKKIADVYLAAAEPEKAYQERQRLFEKYNPRSEWYASMEQRDLPNRVDVLDEAYRLSEEALRINVYYLLSKAKEAEEQGDTTLALQSYAQMTELARQYIDYYPTDDNTYEINWTLALVLDTKLGRFREAYEEYIKVSNDYLETEHQYDAAINAIAVADTLVKMTVREPDTTQGEEQLAQMPARELSPEEQMLAEAYDNFIKWFPNAPETPGVLASAGALYYNHRLFALAKKYYKTMVERYPGAPGRSVGLISLMNSYFFMGQYRDAEIVAKKIVSLSDSLPAEQVELAQHKIAEAIFKNAEKLEQQGKYLEAAREYFRVYQEARDYAEFIDLALLKSARNFEKAEEWQMAINTYQVLVNEYPESKYVLAALGNIAEDYKILEDYTNAARWNEEIFQRFPESKEAQDALYNASYFYEKAEAWADVIRVNNLFIATYPDNPESKNLFFDNAKFYLKLGNLARANQIYQEFASLYPDDPRTVEAFYHRGKYYFERGQLDSAQIEFQRAIQKSEALARAGRDPNLYYAAEAYFQLGEILFKRFDDIELTYPPEVLRARLEEKTRLLRQVVDAFTRVVEFGSIRSFKAMFRIAQAYEVLADDIANQKLPPDLTPEQRLVEEDRVFKASVPAYERAVEEYKSVLENLPVLAEKLGISLTDTLVTQAEEIAQEDTVAAVQRVSIEDTTRQEALTWYNRAQERISLILYNVAERAGEFVTAYVRSPDPFPENDIRNFAYRVRVLRELVAPAIETTIKAHLKNVQVSRELDLHNRYVVESERKVLLTSNILADQYAALFWRAKDFYLQYIPVLEDLIERGETATTPDNMTYYDVQDNIIMVVIRFMDEFSRTAINQYKVSLDLASQYQIQNDALLTTQDKLFSFAFQSGQDMLALKEQAEQKREIYADKFSETERPDYDLASIFFDDQAIELENNAKVVLATAYDIAEEQGIDNLWTKQILAILVELDPERYIPLLPKEEIALATDSTWLATTQYEPGWNQAEYDDSHWPRAVEVQLPVDMSFPIFDSLGVNPAAIWVESIQPSLQQEGLGSSALELKDVVEDTLVGMDTLMAAPPSPDTLTAVQEPDTVTAFFRKNWYIKSTPIGGMLAITGDDNFRLFINEQYIIGQENHEYQNVRVVPFEAIKEILVVGDNMIACRVEDTNGVPHYGLRLYMLVRLRPAQLEELVANLKAQAQAQVDSRRLEKIVTVHRNRIIH